MGLKVLAIESSGMSGEVALLEGDHLLHHARMGPEERTAKFLAARIAASLDHVGWQPSDVDLVAVTQGPGSFTGLRVGITSAKVFAYATNSQVVGVNSLQVVAAQVAVDQTSIVSAVVDAHRQQVFTARFEVSPGTPLPRMLGTPAPVPVEDWLQSRLAESPQAVVSGPVLEKLHEQLDGRLNISEPESWTLRANTVGRLGLSLHAEGQHDDLWGLVPEYYRKSAAEEKAQE